MHLPGIFRIALAIVAFDTALCPASDSLTVVQRETGSEVVRIDLPSVLKLDVSANDLSIYHTGEIFGGTSPGTIPLDNYHMKLVYSLDPAGPACVDPMPARPMRRTDASVREQAAVTASLWGVSMALPGAGTFSIRICDAQGHVAWSTTRHAAHGATVRVPWGEVLGSGSALPTGVYVFSVTSNGISVASDRIVPGFLPEGNSR